MVPELKDILRLLGSIFVCQLAGIIGSVFTIESVSTWYVTLNKPFFTPPSWLFAPAWTTLYTLMGIALYLVWKKGFEKRENRIALYFFFTQLSLNALWSIIFFGLRMPVYAFFEVVILWILILVSAIKFWEIDRRAGALLVPYLAWTTFAALLNLAVWLLN